VRKMRLAEQGVFAATLLFAVAVCTTKTSGQTASATSGQSRQVQSVQSPSDPHALENLPLGNQDRSSFSFLPEVSLASQLLFDFKDSDIKFKLESLMNILKDGRHEGWVLAAYPDPKTGRPLIGAGFNLDVRATQHVQSNPLNSYQFIEPSTPQLWQTAGLDLGRLQSILDQFDRDLKAWKKERFRRKIRAHELSPELTEEEAMRLLLVSALQAIHNARAYCDDFDQLTASQQMALSQLVFQMGVNLQEFVQFLDAINDHPSNGDSTQAGGEDEHWKTVQRTLVQSDWARRYPSRAIAVIAMFDPHYDNDPKQAERQVQAWIHPVVLHHRRKLHAESVRAGANRNNYHSENHP